MTLALTTHTGRLEDVAVAHTEDTNVQIIQNDLGIDNANKMPGVDVTVPYAEDTAVQDNPNWSVNDCIVVRYNDRGYPGVIQSIQDEEIKVKFLKPYEKNLQRFVYPSVDNIQTVDASEIIAKITLLPRGSSRRD